MYFQIVVVLSVAISKALATEYPLKSTLPYKNIYGDQYGSKWILFPDGDNIPHYVNLEERIALRDLADPEYQVQFRLYTRSHAFNYILLDEFALPVNNSNTFVPLVAGAPIKIITHGWMSSADKNAVINIKNEYLRGYNHNVIAVDWSKTADSIIYPSVAIHTRAIGNTIATFIDSLHDRHNVTGEQIHLIGHSLGAHIMGGAASATKLNVYRVTGLDPARPMFEIPPVPSYFKLDQNDATFVDVIHTCGGMLGVQSPIGHVDFYPNSGFAPQPGCDGVQAVFEACSHSRAHFLFAESINNPTAFPAFHCDSWTDFLGQKCGIQQTFMGESATKDVTGVFYLVTNPVRPYGRSFNYL